jgi:NADPH:quinone reductase-like Zn-dependent oxidoreductase
MNAKPQHVIFGTATIGLGTFEALSRRGERVRLVNRSGTAPVPDDVEILGGDASDPGFATSASRSRRAPNMDAPNTTTSAPMTAVAVDEGPETATGRENTMKAIVLDRYGPPDVLDLREIDKPTPKDNEVLVKVHATTVNRTDCGFRAGTPFFTRFFTGLSRPKVTVLGSEFAGEVEAVGSGVTSFEVGDRVFGYSGLRHGSRFGAHAEYLAMPEDGLVATMPANVSFEEAAASTEGSHHALWFIRKAKVRSGQDVLVNGATGAVGSAAVQLLKSMGAQVTAVCDTTNVELVRGLGADRVIDHTAEDFTRDEQTYDVVLDAVGMSSFGRTKRLLKPGGIYVSGDWGPKAQNPALALVTPLFGGKKVIFPLAKDDREMARYLKGLMESGAFRPVIDRRYRLDQIVEAYRYVETGQKIGNVVISVEPSTS